ncbi:putative multiple sugar transport system substrate-binding protein [Oscillospiraceae bacterium]|nr:putative multiple sugar transport system substrate-binding protein [Oscillospiraceae bacterium]
MKFTKWVAAGLCVAMSLFMFAGCAGAGAGGKQKVGVSMPTKDLQRWNQDGDYMKSELEAAGYEVDLQYAANDVATQLSQVENMINSGCDVLVIAAIEGSSLGEALDMAESKNIPVIAYDRLLMESDTVDYYATFDNYMVGTIQGNFIKDQLDLDNAAGPFNLEITAGDPGDNNALFFYQGAMDVLNPYIDEGKLNVVSGQTEFSDVATASWKTETSQSRAETILSSYYADGTNVDVWLCSNDSTALGVENALSSNYTGSYPIITGQDCDIANVKNMLEGKQAMSVFKDTRTLAKQVVKMVGQILKGETVDVNDTETYDNGKKVVPSYLCEPVFADIDNYETILIESGYYQASDLS